MYIGLYFSVEAILSTERLALRSMKQMDILEVGIYEEDQLSAVISKRRLLVNKIQKLLAYSS